MPYDQLASEESLKRAVKSLAANGFNVIVAETGEDAKDKALALIPDGAEAMTMSSLTCTQIGLYKEIDESGRYDSVRAKLNAMDRKTQGREMQRIGAAPEWSVGSVHAITEDGHLLMASNTGSQMPAHVAGASHVILVAGTQKIVKDVPGGIKRIYEHSFVLENERAKKAYGFGSSVNNILIMNKVPQFYPGRVNVILIKENIGF
jgi:hypothetical protein